MRSVSCIQTKNFNTKSIQIKWLDTLEVIEERAMDADELQMGLFPEGKKEEALAGINPTGSSEPPVEGAEATGGSPPESDLPEDSNPFYTGEKERALND